MGLSTAITYDTSGQLSFSSTLVEVSGGVTRLKDLGGATYSMANPAVNSQFRLMCSSLSAFAESASKPAGSEIKYQLIVRSVAYWYNTVSLAWEESDDSYSQANTASELNSNVSTFENFLSLSGDFYVSVRAFLHSDAGSARPSLTSVTLTHAHTEASAPVIGENLVYGYLSDLLGADYVIDSAKPATLHIKNFRAFMYGNAVIRPFSKSAVFNSSGYVELQCMETETPNEKVEISITYYEGPSIKQVRFLPAVIPDLASSALSTISSMIQEDCG